MSHLKLMFECQLLGFPNSIIPSPRSGFVTGWAFWVSVALNTMIVLILSLGLTFPHGGYNIPAFKVQSKPIRNFTLNERWLSFYNLPLPLQFLFTIISIQIHYQKKNHTYIYMYIYVHIYTHIYTYMTDEDKKKWSTLVITFHLEKGH